MDPASSYYFKGNVPIVNRETQYKLRRFVFVSGSEDQADDICTGGFAGHNKVRSFRRREQQETMQPDRKSRLHYTGRIHDQMPSNLSSAKEEESCKKLPTTNIFAAKTKLCHLFLKSVSNLTVSIVLLLLPLLIASSTSDGSVQLSARGTLQQPTISHRRTIDELADLVAPFSPTRSPQSSGSGSSSNRARQQQAGLNGGHFMEPKGESSDSKFSRTSELDMFLDDMNHNELRDVVAGHPISDLFKPKELSSNDERMPAGLSGGQHHQMRAPESDPIAKEHEKNARNSEVVRLDGSGSERQVYSECALILQRTYVKNLDHPK